MGVEKLTQNLTVYTYAARCSPSARSPTACQMLVEGKGINMMPKRPPRVAVHNEGIALSLKKLPELQLTRPDLCGVWSLQADGSGTTFVLAGVTAWVGRWSERVTHWLDDGGLPSKASRMHARLDCDAASGAWSLVDNDSANGCFVNGERVSRAILFPGDRVGFGSPAELSTGRSPQWGGGPCH